MRSTVKTCQRCLSARLFLFYADALWLWRGRCRRRAAVGKVSLNFSFKSSGSGKKRKKPLRLSVYRKMWLSWKGFLVFVFFNKKTHGSFNPFLEQRRVL